MANNTKKTEERDPLPAVGDVYSFDIPDGDVMDEVFGVNDRAKKTRSGQSQRL